MNDNLDNLLEELRSRGVLDSTDAFGVDVIRGESKLGRFQLANPGHYLLKILQAAVVNGATSVSVRLNPGQVRVVCPGPANEAELARLGDSRAQNEHLLLGMRAASAQQPSRLVWQTWTGRKGAELSLESDGAFKLRPLQQAPEGLWESGWVFLLEKPRSFYQKMLGEPNMLAEHHALGERARHFPVPLSLDARLVNGGPTSDSSKNILLAGQPVHPNFSLIRRLLVARVPALLTHCPANQTLLYEVEHRARENQVFARDMLLFQRPHAFLTQFSRIVHEQPWFPLDTVPLQVRPGTGPDHLALERRPNGDTIELNLPVRGELPEQLACHVDLRVPASPGRPTLVTFVKHGISLTAIGADLGCPGAQAVVNLPVTTDLSQFAAVQTVALHNVMLYLRAHVRSMLVDVRPHLARLRLNHPELHACFQKLAERL